MHNRIVMAVLGAILLLPNWLACDSQELEWIAFDYPLLYLHPGSEIPLRVAGGREGGESISLPLEELSISFDPVEHVIADGGGLTISRELLSGELIHISARHSELLAELVVVVIASVEETIDSDGVVLEPASLDVFINKQRSLPSSYIPEDLTPLQVPTVHDYPEVNQLRHSAASALSSLFHAANLEGGHLLHARSGYRSYRTQEYTYSLQVEQYGVEEASRFSARPGNSEHQSGYAIDITSRAVDYQLKEEFGDTPEGTWVAENAHRFGFIIRYPRGKEEITGYAYEPWHLRYVGPTLATKISVLGLTMEEFFDLPNQRLN